LGIDPNPQGLPADRCYSYGPPAAGDLAAIPQAIGVAEMAVPGRRHRRVPGWKARPDEHCCRACAPRVLDWCGSGDLASRPDPGRHGAPRSQAEEGQRENPDKIFDCPRAGSDSISKMNLIPVTDEESFGYPMFQEQAMKWPSSPQNHLRRRHWLAPRMADVSPCGTIGNFRAQNSSTHDGPRLWTRSSRRIVSNR